MSDQNQPPNGGEYGPSETTPYGAPGGPPYGQPGGPPAAPYGQQAAPYGTPAGYGGYPQQPAYPYPPATPARRGGSGTTVVAALLAAAFVVATAIVGYVANHHDKNSSAASGVAPASVSADIPSGIVSGSFPSSELPSIGSSSSVSIGGGGAEPVSTPAPAPVTSQAPKLDGGAVRRTLQTYFNALLYHDLSSLKDATCPKFRYSEKGTYINGNAVRAWRAAAYTIEPDLSYVTIVVTLHFSDPNTGAHEGARTEVYYVKKVPSGSYYVCGVQR